MNNLPSPQGLTRSLFLCFILLPNGLLDTAEALSGAVQNSGATGEAFWWSNPDYDFWSAQELCRSYGATLAVLEDAALSVQLSVGLDNRKHYWVGLFNAAQKPGLDGSWVWANQFPYNASGYQSWGPSQPPAANGSEAAWCVAIQWLRDGTGGGEWAWYADACANNHGALCQLQSGSLGAGMSCLANYDVEQGDAFVSYFPEADTTIGQAKECAQQCQLYGRCDGFTLSYSRGCELRTGRFFSDFPYVPTSPYEAASSPVVYTPSNDVVLSCLKNAVDFEGAGRYGSAQISGNNGTEALSLSCISDYQVNLDMSQALTLTRPACLLMCQNNPACEVLIYHGARSRCVLGSNPMYGSDGAQGYTPRFGMLTCLKDSSRWKILGAIFDPEVQDVSFGLTTYSFHPEALSWAAAEAVCAAEAVQVQARRTGSKAVGGQRAVGHLASVASNEDITLLLEIMDRQPPVFTSPGYGILPDFNGFWVGLSATSSSLTAALSAPPSSFRRTVAANDTSVLRWTDGAAASAGPGASVLQSAWGFSVDDYPSEVPTGFGNGSICIQLSNSTSLHGPGLVVAGDCSWKLPFVCKTILPKPPNATSTSIAQTSSVLANTFLVPLVGSPSFLQPVADKGPLWIPSESDYRVASPTAAGVCSAWGGTLAGPLSPAFQDALTTGMDKSLALWIGLVAGNSTWKWAHLSEEASTAALQNFTSWCMPQAVTVMGVQIPTGYGRGGVAAVASSAAITASSASASDAEAVAEAVASAAASPIPMCSVLRYDEDRCSGGWGWDPSPCSNRDSYLCQLSDQGLVSGNYFCAEGYNLAGNIISVEKYGSMVSSKAMATYCADTCRALGTCHGFTMDEEGNCTLLSRAMGADGGPLPADAIDPSIVVGCLKHALMWADLGSKTAIAEGVTSSISSGYRCLIDQEVTHVTLNRVPINSCRISDCSAQCFLNLMCNVIIYDRETCSCTLGNNPTSGADGITGPSPGVTMCTFASELDFMQVGLLGGLRHIVPPHNSSGPSDLNTWTPLGGWQGSNDGATIIDLDTAVDTSLPVFSNATAAPSKFEPSSSSSSSSDRSGAAAVMGGASSAEGLHVSAADLASPTEAGARTSNNNALVISVSAVAGSVLILVAVVAALVAVQRRSRARGKMLDASYIAGTGILEEEANGGTGPFPPTKNGRLTEAAAAGTSSFVKSALDSCLGGSRVISHSVIIPVRTPGAIGFDQELQFNSLRTTSWASSSAHDSPPPVCELATTFALSMPSLSRIRSAGSLMRSSAELGEGRPVTPGAHDASLLRRQTFNGYPAAAAAAAAADLRRSDVDGEPHSAETHNGPPAAVSQRGASLMPLEEVPLAVSIEGCLELAWRVQEAAARAPPAGGNAQRCTRLSRRVRNLTPLLEKLGPKLSLTFSSPRRGSSTLVYAVGEGVSGMGSAGHQSPGVNPSILALSHPSGSCGSGSLAGTPLGQSGGQTGDHPDASTPIAAGPCSSHPDSALSPLSPLAEPRGTSLDASASQQQSETREGHPAGAADSSSSSAHSLGGLGREDSGEPSTLAAAAAGAEDVVTAALVPKNSCTLPSSVLDALSQPSGGGAGSFQRHHERLLADQIIADCQAVIADSLAWILALRGFDPPSPSPPPSSSDSDGQQQQQQGGGSSPHVKAYSLLDDRLSAAFSDLMYLALAFNINVEHQPARGLLLPGGDVVSHSGRQRLQPDRSSSALDPQTSEGCSASSVSRQQQVRELVAALVQQEWREQHGQQAASISGQCGTNESLGKNDGSMGSGSQGSDTFTYLGSLSSSGRDRLLTVLSAHELELIVFEALSTLSRPELCPDIVAATSFSNTGCAATSSTLAAHLLAILPQSRRPPLPLSSLVHAQEDVDWQ